MSTDDRKESWTRRSGVVHLSPVQIGSDTPPDHLDELDQIRVALHQQSESKPISSRRSILFAIASLLPISRSRAAEKSLCNVMVIPSTHKRLATNPHYSYADLYSLVAAFQPDLVGVEVRQEDLISPDAYLHHNYPEEMIALAHAYDGRVFGFDWLGEELENRAIPEDWWTEQSPIKQLERACDPVPSDKSQRKAQLNARLDALSRQQDQIIETATAASLTDGRYDRVTTEYYRIATELTRGTRCEKLTDWYRERDKKISANIVREVLQGLGHRTAVITGADHYGTVVKALSRLSPSVVLTPVS